MSKPERLTQTVELAQHPIPDDLWAEFETIGYATNDPQADQA